MTDQSGKSNHEVADYISTMTAQMAQMAAANSSILLTHLLEMAWLEAEHLCGRGLHRAAAPVHQRIIITIRSPARREARRLASKPVDQIAGSTARDK